jgi:hypothetical protein
MCQVRPHRCDVAANGTHHVATAGAGIDAARRVDAKLAAALLIQHGKLGSQMVDPDDAQVGQGHRHMHVVVLLLLTLAFLPVSSLLSIDIL